MLARGDTIHPNYKLVLQRAISLGYALPSEKQQIAQSILMSNLVSSGAFGAMDLIYIMQNDCGIDFARINWKDPMAFGLTFPTTIQPMWHFNLGISGRPDLIPGGDFYIETDYIPSVHGINWTDNIAGVHFSYKSGYGTAGYACWTESGTTNVNRTSMYFLDMAVGYGINTVATGVVVSPLQHHGVMFCERLSASHGRLSLNGLINIHSNVLATAGRSSASLKLLGIGPEYPTPYSKNYLSPSHPCQAVLVGQGVSGALQILITSHLQQYQDSFLYTSWDTASTANYTVPAGITQLFVECWGGGGAGKGFPNATATKTGAGGAGGGYSASLLNVTPGQIFPYSCGGGGVGNIGGGVAGGDTSWNGGQVLAKGGAGAPVVDFDHANPGLASAGFGDIKYNGGGGGSQGTVLNASTGSGGSAGGALGHGILGIDAVTGEATARRGPFALLGAGQGGVTHANSYNGPGVNGSWGSGGSGARRTSLAYNGGNGGSGYIRVSSFKAT